MTIYDLYERHVVADRLLHDLLPTGDDSLILDVGGRRGLFSAYTAWSVITVNPDGTGDVVSGGETLPFCDDAFDVVVTLDTLEHMPRHVRSAFLAECLRVAKCGLVVAAPYGSVQHIERERSLDERTLDALGAYHPYLHEHVQYGLPDSRDLAEYRSTLPSTGTDLYYAGDFVWQANAFERSLASVRWPRALSLPFNLVQRVAASALFHPVHLRADDDSTANRFYLVFHK